ncbi:GNAT family N-acetyltransferase [Candidatus Kaiserbacteria bacterium]|nr:GNAT family N-acetyltransferase [Candidatus Kaiserbacteria bacterium]
MHTSPFYIETVRPGLTLKQFSEEDAAKLFSLIDQNRDHLSQFGDETSAKYPDLEMVRQSIVMPKNLDRIRYGVWMEDVLIGSINITPLPDDPRLLEVGYWIGGAHCGRGVATTVTRTLVRTVTSAPQGVTHLVAWVHEKNKASQRVLLKAGLGLSGHFESCAWFSLKI